MATWHEPKTWLPGALKLTGQVLNYELRDELQYLHDNLSGILPPMEAWIAPTLNAPWANVGGSESVAGYCKDAFGWVHLKGSIELGTSGSVAFTLPVDYRPVERRRLATVSNGGANGQLRIDSTGDVRVSDSATSAGVVVPGYVALDGAFRID